jgi:hypothetical protein
VSTKKAKAIVFVHVDKLTMSFYNWANGEQHKAVASGKGLGAAQRIAMTV